MGKNYYWQVFLEEGKYVVKENMFIKVELDIFSEECDDSDNSDDVENLVLIIVYK